MGMKERKKEGKEEERDGRSDGKIDRIKKGGERGRDKV